MSEIEQQYKQFPHLFGFIKDKDERIADLEKVAQKTITVIEDGTYDRQDIIELCEEIEGILEQRV